MMKPVIIIILVALALLIMSCGKEPLPAPSDYAELQLPADGATVYDTRAYLDWHSVENANGYHIILWRGEARVEDRIEFGSSCKTLTPLYPGSYSWTVGVRLGSDDFSGYQDTFHFEVVQEPYQLVWTIGCIGEPNYAVRYGNYMFIADGTAGLGVATLSGTAPQYLSNYETAQQDDARRLFIDTLNERIYIADYRGVPPLACYDISSPDAPVSVILSGIWVRRSEDITGFYRGDTLFIAVADHDDGFFFYRIDESSAIQLGSGIYTNSPAFGIAISGETAVLCCGERGVFTADISDLSSADTVSGFCDTPGNALKAVISGDYAFIADGLGGLQVIDISDRGNPHIAGSSDTQVGNAVDVAVSGNYLALAIGSDGVLLYDISDPTAPYILMRLRTMYANGVSFSDGYLYIADRDWGMVGMELTE